MRDLFNRTGIVSIEDFLLPEYAQLLAAAVRQRHHPEVRQPGRILPHLRL